MDSGELLLEELKDFVLPSATLRRDKPLGSGAYGKVLEVEVPGAICAAKILHESLVHTQTYVRDRFVAECKLMSNPRLRHPRIVQFIGLCPVAESPFPALVMERLHSSLDDVLLENPLHKQVLHLGLKRSILRDVADGLFFLHSFSPDPIVHRDLSAKNVLLNSAMEAKIADFGVARIVDRCAMTSEPGTLSYMPPEALGATNYSTPIDVFSFGHLMLYTLIQEFPCNMLPASYTNSSQELKTRTEIDRRLKYIDSLKAILSSTHCLVRLTQECLANDPKGRPKIEDVSRNLEALVIPNDYEQSTKLEMIRTIEVFKRKENEVKKQLLGQVPIRQNSTISWKRVKEMPFGIKKAFSVVLDGKVYIGGGDTDTEIHEHIILVYNPERDEWNRLPPCPVKKYAMAGFQSELVLAGGRVVRSSEIPGRMKASAASDKVLVWNKHSGEWFEPYPPMPAGEIRWLSSAVGYKHFLIVVGGRNYEESRQPNTLVFDASLQQWFQASPLPSPSKRMPLAVLSDTLYIFGMGSGDQAFSIPLPTLIGSIDSLQIGGATAACCTTWKKLLSTLHCVAAESFLNRIVVAGGYKQNDSQESDRIFYYNNSSEKWEDFTRISAKFKLPFCRSYFMFASLPDQQLLVAGGSEHSEQMEYCKDVYIGNMS